MIERAHRPGKARRTQLRLFVGGGQKAEPQPWTRQGVQALSHSGAVSGPGRRLAVRWQCLGHGDTCWYGTAQLPSASHLLPKTAPEGAQVLLVVPLLASPT